MPIGSQQVKLLLTNYFILPLKQCWLIFCYCDGLIDNNYEKFYSKR